MNRTFVLRELRGLAECLTEMADIVEGEIKRSEEEKIKAEEARKTNPQQPTIGVLPAITPGGLDNWEFVYLKFKNVYDTILKGSPVRPLHL